jgi:hypothetical protein
LRQNGKLLYGKGKDDSGTISVDLRKQDDSTYQGIARLETEDCYFEEQIKILSAINSRIEGKLLFAAFPESKRAQAKYDETCGESESESDNKVWNDFIWIRND